MKQYKSGMRVCETYRIGEMGKVLNTKSWIYAQSGNEIEFILSHLISIVLTVRLFSLSLTLTFISLVFLSV
jgi:hypothetical protein